MIIRVKRNPASCIELAAYLGYPVNSWTLYPDGGHKVDLGVDILPPGQKELIIKKLGELPTHLVEDTTPTAADVL